MKITRAILLTAALAACSQDQDASRQFPLSPSFDRASNTVGQVYTMSNQVAGNAVLAYDRSADGSLVAAGSYPTGGAGTGGGLGNQGGIVLDDAGNRLAVVNAGSNDVSLFRVNGDGTLELTDRIASGGTMPISVTISHDVLYVLNAGGAGNISGFAISPSGDLSSIAGSTRPLSTGASGPAQVSFAPGGRSLVVTEKATNALSTYAVDQNGVATGPVVTPSSGATPFGFGFTHSGTLVVSEAFGGGANASAVSSYGADTDGTWDVISASVATTETAACWIVVTNSGRYAYTTNAGSGTISGYSIQQGGLTLLDASGVTGNIGAGSGPSDMAVSRDSRFLYARAGGVNQIAIFSIAADGSLASTGGWITGLPSGWNGLAAR
ncbi:MAG TPA: beta-propeller fold lactonase family protein [Gemmatimonadaceae bacterium]